MVKTFVAIASRSNASRPGMTWAVTQSVQVLGPLRLWRSGRCTVPAEAMVTSAVTSGLPAAFPPS